MTKIISKAAIRRRQKWVSNNYIGIDMSEEYCALARNRIKQYERQPTFDFD